jgi:hypothetical protein
MSGHLSPLKATLHFYKCRIQCAFHSFQSDLSINKNNNNQPTNMQNDEIETQYIKRANQIIMLASKLQAQAVRFFIVFLYTFKAHTLQRRGRRTRVTRT